LLPSISLSVISLLSIARGRFRAAGLQIRHPVARTLRAVIMTAAIGGCGGSQNGGLASDHLDAAAVSPAEVAPPAISPAGLDAEPGVEPADGGVPPVVIPPPDETTIDAGSVDGAGTVDMPDAVPGRDADAEVAPPDAADTKDLGAAGPDASADVAPIDVAADDAGGPCSGPAASCPSGIAAGHLQLWLRGDQGVTCATTELPARVTSWKDLSGHDNHAVPPAGGKGPLCGTAADAINGRGVVVFPRTPDILDQEHLEVDFRSLAESALTIAVVEKRTMTPRSVYGAWMIGAPLPTVDADRCGLNLNEGMAVRLGYPRPGNIAATFWGEGCDLLQPAPALQTNVSILTFTPGTGMALFINGQKAYMGKDLAEKGLGKVVADPGTPGFRGKGYIGRDIQWALGHADSRYQGSLAEVVIFNTALVEAERKILEAYFHATWDTRP
jgi:hypothetical protein